MRHRFATLLSFLVQASFAFDVALPPFPGWVNGRLFTVSFRISGNTVGWAFVSVWQVGEVKVLENVLQLIARRCCLGKF